MNEDIRNLGTFSTATQSSKTLDLDDLKDALDKFKKAKPKEWAMLSPNGDVFKGTPDQLIALLFKARSE